MVGFAVFRTHADTAALQLMSLEAHANPGPRTSSDRGGLWAVLDAWSKEVAGAGKLPQLLRSYADAAPRGVDALDGLFRAACAAAMELLSDVVSGVMSLPMFDRVSLEHGMLASTGGVKAANLVRSAPVYAVGLPTPSLETSSSLRGMSGSSAECFSDSSLRSYS